MIYKAQNIDNYIATNHFFKIIQNQPMDMILLKDYLMITIYQLNNIKITTYYE